MTSSGHPCARIEEALAFVRPERQFLNPDCGFGTFAARPMNSPAPAAGKLRALVAAAGLRRGVDLAPHPPRLLPFLSTSLTRERTVGVGMSSSRLPDA